MKEKIIEDYIEGLRENNINVTINLTDGLKLKGFIKRFNDNNLLLTFQDKGFKKDILIMNNNISAIVPDKTFELN